MNIQDWIRISLILAIVILAGYLIYMFFRDKEAYAFLPRMQEIRNAEELSEDDINMLAKDNRLFAVKKEFK